jgi:hypothetical protein
MSCIYGHVVFDPTVTIVSCQIGRFEPGRLRAGPGRPWQLAQGRVNHVRGRR